MNCKAAKKCRCCKLTPLQKVAWCLKNKLHRQDWQAALHVLLVFFLVWFFWCWTCRTSRHHTFHDVIRDSCHVHKFQHSHSLYSWLFGNDACVMCLSRDQLLIGLAGALVYLSISQ